jgi:hypothetical protein
MNNVKVIFEALGTTASIAAFVYGLLIEWQENRKRAVIFLVGAGLIFVAVLISFFKPSVFAGNPRSATEQLSNQQQHDPDLAVKRRREWENQQLQYALSLLPEQTTSQQNRIGAYKQVQSALSTLSPDDPQDVVKLTIKATIEPFVKYPSQAATFAANGDTAAPATNGPSDPPAPPEPTEVPVNRTVMVPIAEGHYSVTLKSYKRVATSLFLYLRYKNDFPELVDLIHEAKENTMFDDVGNQYAASVASFVGALKLSEVDLLHGASINAVLRFDGISPDAKMMTALRLLTWWSSPSHPRSMISTGRRSYADFENIPISANPK